MNKIIPHLWFDKEAEQAANFYTAIFKNSSVGAKSHYVEAGKEIHKQEPGSLMTVEFELEGSSFIGLNAGPIFKFNPSISFFVCCEDEEEVNSLYEKLSEGGYVLMELQEYPFSKRYAWIGDKFGVTWQLSVSPNPKQKIAPALLFVGDKAGMAEEAINTYTSLFPDSKINLLSRYGEGMEPNTVNSLNYGSFTLCGQEFVAMDSFMDHKFNFNEAISLLVNCEDQEEIDKYWHALSAVKESEQCGWLKDKFGVSWQITPKNMGDFFASNDNASVNRAMDAMMSMKKIDIAAMEKAAKGEN